MLAVVEGRIVADKDMVAGTGIGFAAERIRRCAMLD